jgi:hypothetical protein
MLDYKGSEPIEFMRAESTGFRDTDRLQPELCHVVTVLNVDVRRFRSFQAIEEEAKSRSPQDGRHLHAPTNRYYFRRFPSTAATLPIADSDPPLSITHPTSPRSQTPAVPE